MFHVNMNIMVETAAGAPSCGASEYACRNTGSRRAIENTGSALADTFLNPTSALYKNALKIASVVRR
jgi:hypothetical protein